MSEKEVPLLLSITGFFDKFLENLLDKAWHDLSYNSPCDPFDILLWIRVNEYVKERLKFFSDKPLVELIAEFYQKRLNALATQLAEEHFADLESLRREQEEKKREEEKEEKEASRKIKFALERT